MRRTHIRLSLGKLDPMANTFSRGPQFNTTSQFHFHIAHVPSKLKPMANALLRRLQVNAITISHHKDHTSIVNDYTHDEDFAKVYDKVEQGESLPPYSIKGQISHVQSKSVHHKVLQAERYARNS